MEFGIAAPDENPLFSVWLDTNNRVIDYRQDIGLNGMVLHRDINDIAKLHLYIMSYERITLIGHYVLDLTDIVAVSAPLLVT